MVELTAEIEMDASVVAVAPIEDVEQMLKDTVAGKLTTQIMEKLEEMNFLDMELDEEKGKFHVTAELVLCSKQSVLTNIEVMGTKLRQLDLSEEEIVDVLSTLVEDTKGF